MDKTYLHFWTDMDMQPFVQEQGCTKTIEDCINSYYDQEGLGLDYSHTVVLDSTSEKWKPFDIRECIRDKMDKEELEATEERQFNNYRFI